MKIIELLLTFLQPFTVIVFLLSGILCLIIGNKPKGYTNLAVANFIIFYGDRLFRK